MANNNTLGVYTVRKYTLHGEERSQWLKIGVAWPHKNGDGFSVRLTAFPLDGVLTVIPFKKDDDKE